MFKSQNVSVTSVLPLLNQPKTEIALFPLDHRRPKLRGVWGCCITQDYKEMYWDFNDLGKSYDLIMKLEINVLYL